MHRRQHGDRLLRDVDAREDLRGLDDPRQALRENFRREVVEVEVDVVFFGAYAAALADLHGHRTRHDVARREVLRGRRVALHEPLAVGVAQHAALAAAAFRDEAARAVDPRGVELHELEVLLRQPRAGDHGVAVAGAGVGGGGGEVAAAVAAGREDGGVRAEAVESAVLEAQREHAEAFAGGGVNEEVEGKVFDEEVGVVLEGLPVEGVEERVAGAVGGGGAAVRLPAFSKVEGLPAKGALVDLALLVAGEGDAVLFELDHGLRGLAAHVVNRVLVTKPVAPLHGVVHVPPPVVLRPVPQRGVNAALRGDGVAPRREQLRDARGLEPGLAQPDHRAQAGTAGAHDDGVVRVVDDGVGGGLGGECAREK
mmetsp:Transcript_21345/g.52551  ORF Transcript_21345/g.52551 Transcript_21345/m.52551 type:complete len:368 (+) Transcript_21345:832-1935(+)